MHVFQALTLSVPLFFNNINKSINMSGHENLVDTIKEFLFLLLY